ERPTLCREGSRIISWRSDLVVHVQFHANERPYRCLECGKSFSQSSEVFIHCWLIHTGERPYTCGECGKSFNKNSNLIIRQCIH
ncbi:ZG49 protein, partial [Pitta sordida]|nr:ZG49 protein [Pitta sordida]